LECGNGFPRDDPAAPELRIKNNVLNIVKPKDSDVPAGEQEPPIRMRDEIPKKMPVKIVPYDSS